MGFLSACPVGDEVEMAPRWATWRGGQDGHRRDDYKIGTERGFVKGQSATEAVNDMQSTTGAPKGPVPEAVAVPSVGSVGVFEDFREQPVDCR